MKISDYRVTSYYGTITCRHIGKSYKKCLCGYRHESELMYRLEDYSLGTILGVKGVPVCKKCLNLLPVNIKEQVIQNLIITKLKS